MSDPYLDALEQLDQMRDRAFKAEAAIARVRAVCEPISGNKCDLDIAADYSPLLARDILRALEGDNDD